MDETTFFDVLKSLSDAESSVSYARRCAAAIGNRHYDSIALIQRELAELYDLIARDANKETGK